MDGKENFICSDYNGNEHVLKPMSDNGKRDIHFSVKRTEFKKLPPPTLLQRKCS
jgi:hypothetical protein